MARGSRFFIILSIISLFANTIDSRTLDRHSFPDGFVFGTAASAYQVTLMILIFQWRNSYVISNHIII